MTPEFVTVALVTLSGCFVAASGGLLLYRELRREWLAWLMRREFRRAAREWKEHHEPWTLP